MSTDDQSQSPSAGDIAVMGHDLGRQLADLRQVTGLTQHQMAKLIGYARGTLSAVESGRFDQARRFWQQCDELLNAEGQLVGRFDEIKAHIAADRERRAQAAQAERDARLAAWRQTRQPGIGPEQQPPTLHPEVSDTDIHVWFTTDEGVTHCLIIPRARISPELLAETLRKLLGT